MKNELKSAEAHDLGTDSNRETREYFNGSVACILPYSFGEAAKNIVENCGRCGKTGDRVLPQRGRSTKLCWECTFTPASPTSNTLPTEADDTAKEGRRIPLFGCLACGKAFSAAKMSSVLVVCKACRLALRACNDVRQIDRIERRISRMLRRWL